MSDIDTLARRAFKQYALLQPKIGKDEPREFYLHAVANLPVIQATIGKMGYGGRRVTLENNLALIIAVINTALAAGGQDSESYANLTKQRDLCLQGVAYVRAVSGYKSDQDVLLNGSALSEESKGLLVAGTLTYDLLYENDPYSLLAATTTF